MLLLPGHRCLPLPCLDVGSQNQKLGQLAYESFKLKLKQCSRIFETEYFCWLLNIAADRIADTESVEILLSRRLNTKHNTDSCSGSFFRTAFVFICRADSTQGPPALFVSVSGVSLIFIKFNRKLVGRIFIISFYRLNFFVILFYCMGIKYVQ